jgi:hypothetical protein
MFHNGLVYLPGRFLLCQVYENETEESTIS